MKPTGPVLALIVAAALGGVFAFQQITLRRAAQPQSSQTTGSPSVARAAEDPARTAKGEKAAAAPGGSELPALQLDERGRIAQTGTSQAVPVREWPSMLERALVQGTVVDGGATQRLLMSKDFDAYLAQLSRDADADAVAQARDYREVLEESLAEVAKGAALDRIACGREFCIANLRSQAGSDFGAWYRSIQSATPIPMQVMTSAKIPQPNGAAEYRVFFTTNTAVKSVRMPHRPPPQPRAG
jgi:hypothetical protein